MQGLAVPKYIKYIIYMQLSITQSLKHQKLLKKVCETFLLFNTTRELLPGLELKFFQFLNEKNQEINFMHLLPV